MHAHASHTAAGIASCAGRQPLQRRRVQAAIALFEGKGAHRPQLAHIARLPTQRIGQARFDLGTARVCSVTCATGTCPANFSCRQALAPDGTTNVPVCFPNGGGKPGADCNFGPAACESGLCIRKDSGPICTAGCTTDAECPDGWLCDLLRSVTDQSVQACLPPALQDG
jgi:hypothetical protein